MLVCSFNSWINCSFILWVFIILCHEIFFFQIKLRSFLKFHRLTNLNDLFHITQLFSWLTSMPPFLVHLLITSLFPIHLPIWPFPLASFIFCLIYIIHNISRAFLQAEPGLSATFINPLIQSLNIYWVPLMCPGSWHFSGSLDFSKNKANLLLSWRLQPSGGNQAINVKCYRQEMTGVLFYFICNCQKRSLWAADIWMNWSCGYLGWGEHPRQRKEPVQGPWGRSLLSVYEV